MTPRRILIGGSVRSGKSAVATSLARRLGERCVCVATARPVDDEMGARIARHRADRGPNVRTPYARQAGLGRSFKAHALPRHVRWATAFVVVIVLW